MEKNNLTSSDIKYREELIQKYFLRQLDRKEQRDFVRYFRIDPGFRARLQAEEGFLNRIRFAIFWKSRTLFYVGVGVFMACFFTFQWLNNIQDIPSEPSPTENPLQITTSKEETLKTQPFSPDESSKMLTPSASSRSLSGTAVEDEVKAAKNLSADSSTINIKPILLFQEEPDSSERLDTKSLLPTDKVSDSTTTSLNVYAAIEPLESRKIFSVISTDTLTLRELVATRGTQFEQQRRQGLKIMKPNFPFSRRDTTVSNQLQRIAKEFLLDISPKGTEVMVLVLDFKDTRERETRIGSRMAEEFRYYLANNSRSLKVLDRSTIDDIKLESVSLMNGALLSENSTLDAVDIIVWGRTRRLEEGYIIDLRAIRTKTSEVIASTQNYIDRPDNPFRTLIDRLAEQENQEEQKRKSTAKRSSLFGIKSLGAVASSLSAIPENSVVEKHLLFDNIKSVSFDTSVEIKIRIVSRGIDDVVSFSSSGIKVWDSSGKEYEPSMISLGGKENIQKITESIISDIPTQLVLTFDIDPSITKITMLQVLAKSSKVGSLSVRMRDLIIE